MTETKKTTEELSNDSQIPSEMKEELNQKTQKVLGNIKELEGVISNAIDDLASKEGKTISICEIMAALMNIQRKMNQYELMQLIK